MLVEALLEPDKSAGTELKTMLLSICIPTYNRALFLGQTIDSVLAQATDETELVISDNASSDSTAEIVLRYQEQFPNITYFRHTENVGRDRNYLKVIEAAQGEYCWFLGDDDALEPGAVERLLSEHLKRARPDFLLLTGTVYDSEMNQVRGHSAQEIGVTENISTRDVSDFFVRFFCESGLSVYVIRREKWSQINPEKYLGTGLVYLGIVYEYLALDSLVEVVALPSIKYRSGNASWSKDTLEIIIGHMGHVMKSLPSRYDSVKGAAMARYQRRVFVSLRMLFSLRAEGYYNHALYRKYMAAYFRHRPASRLLAALIAVLPQKALRGIKLLLGKGG